jgi:DNA-binding transcriptional MocR family regulator
VKAYDTGGRVLLCSSDAKILSPTVRVGYVAAGRYAQQVALLKNVASGGTNHFFQAVLADFIGSTSYDSHLRKLRRTMVQRVARMSDAILEYFPAKCSVSSPQGGNTLWVQMPESVDALELHERAIANRIGILPGVLFSAGTKFKNYMRLNCGNAWSAEIENAVRILGELIDTELQK